MVVDSSALCAVLFNERERDHYVAAMSAAKSVVISAATLLEYEILAISRLGAEGEFRAREVMDRMGVIVVAFDEAQAHFARQGFRLYGKGRHAAGLNFGDCFAYGLAKVLGEPLLFKGDDFRKTDVTPAL